MKTNTKIELGLLGFVTLLSLILQVYMRQSVNRSPLEISDYSGVMKTMTHNVPAFTAIETELDMEIEYLVGSPKVVIYADESRLSNYKVKVAENGVLELNYAGRSENGRKKGNDRQFRTCKVYNDKALDNLSIYGNGVFNFGDYKQNEILELYSSGNSSIKGSLTVDSIIVSTRDNSTIRIDGTSQYMKAKTTGNSKMGMKDYKTAELKLNSRDNSHGQVQVEDVLDVSARGNSNFTIYGTPAKSKSNSSDNASLRFVDSRNEE